jgi:hypothetical protein
MNAILKIAGLSVIAFSNPAFGQVFTIWAEAPETVTLGETYTVEFWGSVEGEPWVDGVSALAGFGIDALGSGNVASVTTASIADWAVGFGREGVVNGIDVEAVSGGQLPLIVFPPDFNWDNPSILFTIEVTATSVPGSITYVPGNPNINGGLSFYPDSFDGVSIVAPNDQGTTLVLVGATTRVVPAPVTLGAFGFLACARRWRRTI